MTNLENLRTGIDIDLALRVMLQRAYANTDVRVDASYPGPERLPSVSAVRAGGVPDWPPLGIDRPRCDINCYAATRQRATNLCLQVVAYLRSLEGNVITFGNVSRFVLSAVDEVGGIIVSRDDDGIWRALTAVVLVIHQRTSPMR